MPIGILNPGDVARTTGTRPAATLNAVNQRRWFSDALRTEMLGQDFNAILGQLRYAYDFYSVPDVEGDEAMLQKAIAAGAASLTGNAAALQAVVGAADKVPYWTSPTAMSSFLMSSYSRTLASKTSLSQWQDALGITASASANVVALAGLVGGANQLPYFTGAGTMSQTPYTAYARTLDAAIDAAAARTVLGLGTMATQSSTGYAQLNSPNNFTAVNTFSAEVDVVGRVYVFNVLATGGSYLSVVNTGSSGKDAFFLAGALSPGASGIAASRWAFGKDDTPEAVGDVGNVGSNFRMLALGGPNAAGETTLGNAFTIVRATRVVTFNFSPLAPTPTYPDNSTKLATTAYVASALSGSTAGYATLAGPNTFAATDNTFGGLVTFNGAVAGVAAIFNNQVLVRSGSFSVENGPVVVDRAAVTGAGNPANANMEIRSGVGAYTAGLYLKSANSNRWGLIKSGVVESGSNVGSDLSLTAYSDAGAVLGTALTIPRATQVVAFTKTPTAPTPALADNSTQVATTAFVYSGTRIRLTADLTVTVAASGGNDANVAGPFATKQGAIDMLQKSYDWNGYIVTIQVEDNADTAGTITLRGCPHGAAKTDETPLKIRGNATNPALCPITIASGTCIHATAGARVAISGFKLTAGTGTAILGAVHSFVGVEAPMEFGACGTHISGASNCNIHVSGAYTISGGGGRHVRASSYSTVFLTGICTISTPVTFTVAFLEGVEGGLVGLQNTGPVNPSNVTGPKFNAQRDGIVYSTAAAGLQAIPGTVDGTYTNDYGFKAAISIASAATLNLMTPTSGIAGNFFILTGSTAITSFGPAPVGTVRWVRIAAGAAPLITASPHILMEFNNGVSKQTAQGDSFLAMAESTLDGTERVWRIISYHPAVTSSITLTGAGLTPLLLESTDAGTAAGPILSIRRTSASPAANDFLGSISFEGQDLAVANAVYADLYTQILDPTAVTKAARAALRTMIAGTLQQVMWFGPGVQVGTPTGGDKGAGTLNATTLYEAGTSIATKYQALDATLTAMAGQVTAADKVLYFTGVDVASTMTVTAAARTVLDDTTVAAMLATLGGAPLASPTFTGTVSAGGLSIPTGNVSVNGGVISTNRSGDAADAEIWLVNDAGFAEFISYRTGGNARWQVGKNATGEAGSNAGSDFYIAASDDAGAPLGNALLINRASRVVDFPISPTAPTPTAGDSTTRLATTAFVSAAVGGAGAQPLDAELTALSGLASAADTQPYFTGSGTAALTPFPAYGRSLSGVADATAALTLLGTGTAALAATGTTGHTLPYLDGANTWSALNTFTVNGVVIGAPTGGDKGAGSLNSTTIWLNGVTLGTAATKNTSTSGANIPLMSTAATWSAAHIFTLATVGATPITIISTEAAAAAGPILDIFRNSATPADADAVGLINFNAADSALAKTAFASIGVALTTVLAASKAAAMTFTTFQAGAAAARLIIAAGLTVGAATGGDKGAGTVNATALYEQGTAISATYATIASLSSYATTASLSSYATTAAMTAADALLAPLAGATFTGDVFQTAGVFEIDRTGDAAQAQYIAKADAGQSANINFRTGTATRWLVGKNTDAESTGNAGGNFHIWAYDDAGASIGRALLITRSTRVVDFFAAPTIAGATLASLYQPLDATLTAFAGITGALNAADKFPYFTGTDAMTTTTITSVARTVLDDTTTAAMLTTLGAQPLDATLTAYAAFAGTADAVPYFTAADVLASMTVTAAARTVLDDTTVAAMLTTLGGAPLASPTFTGTPAAPTAGAGVSTTQLATCAFVQQEIASDLTLYAPLASPALTGTPTAPTATLGTNTTQVATTAFVLANGGGVSLSGTNTWTAAQTMSLATVGATPLTLISTEAAAALGPVLDIYRNSATPANSDWMGGITFTGMSSTAVKRTYASIEAGATDVTNASEDGKLALRASFAGALADAFTLTVSSSGLLSASLYGNMTIRPASGGVGLTLDAPTTAQARTLTGLSQGLYGRWRLTLGDAAAESGADAGSNMTLVNCTDGGANIGTVFTIYRSTGGMVFGNTTTGGDKGIGSINAKALYLDGVAVGVGGGQPVDATLTALSGLTTGADLVPLFTGVDAATTFTVTSIARTVLDDTTTAAMLTTLGAAALAGPTFTGVPAAPTAAAATNTTQLATCAFVTTADNLKANIASPTFTGAPLSTTPSVGDNTTKIATTAFVVTGFEKLGTLAGVNTQTASYTLVLTDVGKVVEINNASANTLTVPPNATVAFAIGSRIDIVQYGAGQTTLTPGAGVTIRSSGTKLKLTGLYAAASLYKRGTDEWVAMGDLSA